MDRSIAARLGRPFGVPSARPRARSPRADCGARRLRRNTRVGIDALLARKRLCILLLSALVALAALSAGWLWLRHSPLAAVEHVHLSGVHGPEAGAIEEALSAAARGMSTLAVNHAALRDAVSSFAVVREVQARPSFPHGLDIRVIEQPPVAALIVGGSRTAVAADGVVLGPELLSSSLPALSGSYEPAAGQRLSSPGLLAALSVLGAAPAPLARFVERASIGADGVTLAMRDGLIAYFGDDARPHAKWLSLARVLADPGSAGASYIDVRLPERPAAGFPAGVAPPDAASQAGAAAGATAGAPAGAGQTSTTESAVSELAAGLTPASAGASATGSQVAGPAAGGAAQPQASTPPAASAEPQEAPTAAATESSASAAAPGG